MQEQLLHFIWQRTLFDQSNLITTQGHTIEIIHGGFPNHDQGPDFLQARIRFNDHLWAGHVEIHIHSSSWFLHSHERDTHYNNVILHVVWQEDVPAITSDGTRIPCLELSDRVERQLLDKYKALLDNGEWVACSSSLHSISDLIKISWLERMMSERLERKTTSLHQIVARCNHDYEQAFFTLLAKHLGSPANSDAMENLGLKVPLNILRKHGDRIDQIEAILFGVAGMLEKEPAADYPMRLKKEFDFLKKKYGLSIIPALQWKFMRMRPVHFPTIRIAQLSVIISRVEHFIPLLTALTEADQWIKIFSVKPDNAFWDTHYHFRSESPYSEKKLGKDTAISIVINVVVPFMFYYGKMQGFNKLKERAGYLLSQLPAEKNSVIKSWQQSGWKAEDALQTQALLQLKKEYCDQRKCLQCAIGLQLLK